MPPPSDGNAAGRSRVLRRPCRRKQDKIPFHTTSAKPAAVTDVSGTAHLPTGVPEYTAERLLLAYRQRHGIRTTLMLLAYKQLHGKDEQRSPFAGACID